MYDKTELKLLGIVSATVSNPKTKKSEMLDFYVVPRHKQAILGAAACQLLQLLSVRTGNILAAEQCAQEIFPVTKENVIREYNDVRSTRGRPERTPSEGSLAKASVGC